MAFLSLAATHTARSAVLTNNTVWLDDALPAGSTPGSDGGDSWLWAGSNPAPLSGTAAHQSGVAAGLHQHYFSGATQTLAIGAGEILFAWVYLDPANLPTEVMLQWNNGNWEHRAYWGSGLINYGMNGTDSSRYMGPLPSPGQWVRLEVPASAVGLEGSSVNGMAFSLYDGRATWDAAGKSVLVVTTDPGTNSTPTNTIVTLSTNAIPGSSSVDYLGLALPDIGDHSVHILSPTLLELKLINTQAQGASSVSQWPFVDAALNLAAPAPSAFSVLVNGQVVAVSAVGFKRRPLYAPFEMYDLRVENSLYLRLASPISDNQTLEVKNPDATLWPSSTRFISTTDPLRYSPAIHVNHEGYMPGYSKKGMVGYYLGSMGEMSIPISGGFKLVDANTGATVYSGSLVRRLDTGWNYAPPPYSQVYEADFSSFNTPGQYRLVVPGMGGSVPFVINEGISMDFARAYALGLYHQRCGTNTAMPYTRFTHDPCHVAAASVPLPQSSYPFTWNTVAGYATNVNHDNPTQTAPLLTSPAAQLFPFVRTGTLDVSGGHHDAGDYSKYTMNSANLIHFLMFAVDSLPGVAALDNLGIPESGDGISDVMQEAKWEADFIAKLQDSDGGFYFLVYPVNREYEGWVTPDHGDAQVVWPKNTSITAAATAALAQCASSPAFKRAYPQAAATYLAKAKLGWQFLLNAVNTYGKTGAYQKITHYGDDFADYDELAWAACEMYLATGDATIQQKLLSWFDPANPATWHWGWWHMPECYGHAIRSYAFAARNGRMQTSQLDATFLAKCQTQVAAAGDDMLKFSLESAYGTSFPDQTKNVLAAGWYFSTDQAFDLAVAYALNPKPSYMDAMVANMNYEGGCNPVNVSYVTGLGWKRQRDIVSQWHSVSPSLLPPSGIPVGNIAANPGYLYTYQGLLEGLCFPSDNVTVAPYPFYDRWSDSWNVTAEFTILNSARSLGTLAFMAAQTSLKTQPWQAVTGQILTPSGTVPVGSPVTLSLVAPGLDLSGARITWETRDFEPAFGQTFTFAPKNNGTQWVQAEAQYPDGRRVFATGSFQVNAPDIVWVEDAVPAGATTGAEGGDGWNWLSSNPAPHSGNLAFQSALAAGAHQMFFYNATATLQINVGDVLYAYVYLDPANPPSEVMLQWNNGNWEHRAYWGANALGSGTAGTPSRQYMGALPTPGQWVQLKVPANVVALEGSTLNGMAFTLYNGRATWDTAGRLIQKSAVVTNSVRVTLMQVTPSGPKLTWASTSGSVYRVTYKDSLQASTWTTLGSDLTATGTTLSFTDTTATGRTQRYYVINKVQ